MAASSIKVLKLIPVEKGETCAYCRHLKKKPVLRRIFLGEGAYQVFDSAGVPWYYHPSCAATYYKHLNDPFNALDDERLSDFEKQKIKNNLIKSGHTELLPDEK